jgi:hypothetical protein
MMRQLETFAAFSHAPNFYELRNWQMHEKWDWLGLTRAKRGSNCDLFNLNPGFRSCKYLEFSTRAQKVVPLLHFHSPETFLSRVHVISELCDHIKLSHKITFPCRD